MLSLLEFLKNLLSLLNGGASANAPKNDADSILTLKNVTSPLLVISRTKKTEDALFGKVTIGGEDVCFSMERTVVAIPEGVYPCCKRYSPHNARTVIGIDVPNRTDIEIHPANYPSQLEGCIAVGSTVDNDALDNSTAAFEKLMTLLPQTFTLQIMSLLA